MTRNTRDSDNNLQTVKRVLVEDECADNMLFLSLAKILHFSRCGGGAHLRSTFVRKKRTRSARARSSVMISTMFFCCCCCCKSHTRVVFYDYKSEHNNIAGSLIAASITADSISVV